MAEETLTTTPEVENTSNEEVENLKAELEKARDEAQRFKKSIDKLTKEAAEKKREERAKLSEDERTKQEQLEEFERLKEKADADAKELNRLKAVTAYKGIEEAVIEKLVDAVDDKDHTAIAGIIKTVVEKAKKEQEAEWKKSRPDAIIGNGGAPTMTKEQILAIEDDDERVRQIAQHRELF